MTALSRWRAQDGLVPALLGVWAAAIALAPGTAVKLSIALPVMLGGLVWWIVNGAGRWVALFLLTAILLPPIPAPYGNSGVHIAPLLALIGILSGLLRMNEWRPWRGPLPLALCGFSLVLAASTAFAALYSGWSIAAGSAARVVLFGLGVYVFLYTFAGPSEKKTDPLRLTKWLFLAGAAGALFACLDFYYQWPAPAGYGAQFIWTEQEVLRRAQGLFYEASTLGNFCAFFLVMILAAFFRPSEERPCSRKLLVIGGLFFSGALIFSYSRASLAALVVAGCAFVIVRRLPVSRTMMALGLAAAGLTIAGWLIAPSLSAHYWLRIRQSAEFVFAAPNAVLSGRISSWSAIVDFLLSHPSNAAFGIGYKTLPYTDIVGVSVVADNTYLSLLAETGVIGLSVFIALNAAILRTAWRAARSVNPRASLFGTWIFCFWCGEIVQMLSGDLITYWRVLPIYFWVLAIAAREAIA